MSGLGQEVRPDIHGEGSAEREQFEKIERVFVALTNPDSRAAYDAILSGNATPKIEVDADSQLQDPPPFIGVAALVLGLICALFAYLFCVSFFSLTDIQKILLASALIFPAALVPGVLAYRQGGHAIPWLCSCLVVCGFLGILKANNLRDDNEKKWQKFKELQSRRQELERRLIEAQSLAKRNTINGVLISNRSGRLCPVI